MAGKHSWVFVTFTKDWIKIPALHFAFEVSWWSVIKMISCVSSSSFVDHRWRRVNDEFRRFNCYWSLFTRLQRFSNVLQRHLNNCASSAIILDRFMQFNWNPSRIHCRFDPILRKLRDNDLNLNFKSISCKNAKPNSAFDERQ